MGEGLTSFSCNVADYIELSFLQGLMDKNAAGSRWDVDGMICHM